MEENEIIEANVTTEDINETPETEKIKVVCDDCGWTEYKADEERALEAIAQHIHQHYMIVKSDDGKVMTIGFTNKDSEKCSICGRPAPAMFLSSYFGGEKEPITIKMCEYCRESINARTRQA